MLGQKVKLHMEFSEQDIKAALFEIFSAGYEAGYAAETDIKTAYKNWYERFRQLMKG